MVYRNYTGKHPKCLSKKILFVVVVDAVPVRRTRIRTEETMVQDIFYEEYRSGDWVIGDRVEARLPWNIMEVSGVTSSEFLSKSCRHLHFYDPVNS